LKKKSWVPAIAALLAGSACAQTNVTLYGAIDSGVEIVNNAPDANGKPSLRSSLKPGSLWASRWGLQGQEDLGDGLKLIFHLENGFASDTGVAGQKGRLFGRQAYVGLAGKFNSVTLGRQSTSLLDVIYPYEPLGMAAYSVLKHDGGMAGRADNAIKYNGKFKDVKVTGFYSFGYDGTLKDGGEMAGASKVGRELGGGLRYAPGALDIGLAFGQRHGTSLAAQNKIEKRIAAVISYGAGPVRAYAGYRWLKSDIEDIHNASDLYWGGLKYQATPAFSVAGMTSYTDTRRSNADPITFSLLGTYDLSKRSALYLMTSYALNQGGSTMGVNGFDKEIVPGANQVGVIAGIRHMF
jgi:predicted porin